MITLKSSISTMVATSSVAIISMIIVIASFVPGNHVDAPIYWVVVSVLMTFATFMIAIYTLTKLASLCTKVEREK
jgi:drug/metabolite transporter (DMT)-like permease